MKKPVFELKGEMSLLNVLLLHAVDMNAITQAIQEKRETAWQVLERSPVIVDCQQVAEQLEAFDFQHFKTLIVEAGLIPVGIRNLPEDSEESAVKAGWAILRPGRSQTRTPPVKNKPVAEPVQRLMMVERPVRSGQQVYCPDGDIVVLQQTSAGSELLAGGSVHVYGALRGRVLAGVQGDTEARIFCQHLEAELVAIAGRYRLLDEMEDNLKGQAVMVYLDGEKLKIVAI
ncbi:MAG: septum site-determining protein MinC [Thiolinea sp.]